MSLSGNLGFVPIDEILRLLTRAEQQGSVEVTGDGLQGRVFVGRGGIDLATTWSDDDLHRHLVNSGFSDENSLRRIQSGETTLAVIAESNQAMVDLIREMTVESIYQIAHRGDEFDVQEGQTTPYASPKSFELEALLEDSRQREKEWATVAQVVSDLTGAVSFRRDLGEREEVTVNVEDWKVLSEIGTGSSVREIADHLGTTEFWTAKVAARLVEDRLVNLGEGTEPISYVAPIETAAEPEVVEESVEAEASNEVEEAEIEEAPAADVADVADVAEVVEAPTSPDQDVNDEPEPVESELDEDQEPVSADSADAEDVDPNESWWQEPAADETDGDEDDEARTPEVVAEGLSAMPSVENEEDSEVEEDTEAFLEKVFSELDSPEPEEEEGYGLLRRRRMGTLRDFSSDS